MKIPSKDLNDLFLRAELGFVRGTLGYAEVVRLLSVSRERLLNEGFVLVLHPAFEGLDKSTNEISEAKYRKILRKELGYQSIIFRKKSSFRVLLGSLLPVALVMCAIFLMIISPVIRNDPFRRWKAEHFNNRELLGIPRVYQESSIQHNWGLSGPSADFATERSLDNFSVRWSTCVFVPEDKTITFSLGSDDGSRLFLDNSLIIDNWKFQGLTYLKRQSKVKAGFHPLRVEYFDLKGGAQVYLDVRLEGGDKEVSIEEVLSLYPVIELPIMGSLPCSFHRFLGH